jgi:hypothetical protein
MITILITIALVGLVAWALTYFIPMPDKFKTLIYVVAAVFMLLYVLSAFGVYHMPALK